MSPELDFLLGDIVEKIQLSPTKYALAGQHYKAIAEYLRGAGSPLADLYREIYPQGSFRIGSTISSLAEADEHDIDLMLELAAAPGTPQQTIDILFQALDRGPGGKYHGQCERRNRCVTVHYEDMHLDVTPSVLAPGWPIRTSWIFDARLPYPILANPEGFARWFESQIEPAILAKRAVAPLPKQKDPDEKPTALQALQLIKRWRNIKYENRNGRKPPSVLLAKLVADLAGPERSIAAQFRRIVAGISLVMQTETAMGRLLHVPNPACTVDILTDRWPGQLAAQRLFMQDLVELQRDLDALAAAQTKEARREILARLFGEAVTIAAYRTYGERLAEASLAGRLGHYPGSGRIAAPTVLGGGTGSIGTPPHTFFGR